MYEKLMDGQTRQLYDGASGEVSLEAEIRILRARLALAVSGEDDRAIIGLCGVLARLVRAQEPWWVGRDRSESFWTG